MSDNTTHSDKLPAVKPETEAMPDPESLALTPYIRYENGRPEQMMPIGPHQTVSRGYYDANFRRTLSPKSADDSEKSTADKNK